MTIKNFMNFYGTKLRKATDIDIIKWINYRENQNISMRTVDNNRTQLGIFYQYLKDTDKIKINPVKLVGNIKYNKNIRQPSASSIASTDLLIVQQTDGTKKATIKETVTAVTDTSPVNGSSNLITSNAVYGVKSEADANRLMFAPVESTSIASKAYNIGDYLVYNGLLYKVTVAIIQSGAINPGVNCVATTVSEQIKTNANDIITTNNKIELHSAVLTAGSTSVDISDSSITTDLCFDLYVSIFRVSPTAVNVETGKVTFTFDAQESDMTVAIAIRR
jgi:hypothetical protein